MKGITGLAHVTLKVSDIERTLAFYTGVLGLAEIMRLHHDDGRLYLVYLRVTDEAFIEIFPEAESDTAPGPMANGIHHFCISVADIDAALAQIGQRGGVFGEWVDGALVTSAKPVVYDGLDGNRQSWLADPDGNKIELMQMSEDSLQARGIRALRVAATA